MVVICEQCGKNFPKPCKLKYHIQTVHLKIKNFQCEICNELFASSTALKFHHARKHSDACDFSCEDCGRSFKTQSGLDQHYTIHDKGKIFTCSECGLEMKHRSHHKNHLKKHEKILDTSCKICNKQFPDYKKKKEHEYNTHRKNPQIPCPFCSKVIYTQATLEKHLANHPVFKCDICDHTDLKRSDFNKHMHDHLRELGERFHFKPKMRKSKTMKKVKISRRDRYECNERLERLDSFLVSNIKEEAFSMNIKEEPNPLEDELMEIKEEIMDEDFNDNEHLNQLPVKVEHLNDYRVLTAFESVLVEPLQATPFSVSEDASLLLEDDDNESSTSSSTVERKIRKPFDGMCSKCDETFSNRIMFKNHWVKMHGGMVHKVVNQKNYSKERKFVSLDEMICFSCPAHFSGRREMKAHTMKKHGRKSKYDCLSCQFTFVSPQALHQHKVKFHDDGTLKPGRKTCKVCRQKFDTILAMREHYVRVHERGEKLEDEIIKMEVTSDFKEEFDNEMGIDDVDEADDFGIQLKCRSCLEPKFFNRLYLLQHHVRSHHLDYSRPDRHFCIDCAQMCSNKDELKAHGLQEHQRSYDFDCDLCEFTFTGGQARSCHKLSVHGIGSERKKIDRGPSKRSTKFACDLCNQKFRLSSLLREHKLEEHNGANNEAKFDCEQCDEKFFHANQLFEHLTEVHKIEGRFKCPKCEQMFKVAASMEKHFKDVHELKKVVTGNFDCKNCTESYTTIPKLQQHVRKKHVDHLVPEKMYCGICSEFCSSREEMKQHTLQAHQQESKFDCPTCAFTFLGPLALYHHKGIAHEPGLWQMKYPKNDEGKYTCSHCPAEFATNSTRQRHILQAHEQIKRYPCKICEELFSVPDHIVKHMRKVHDGGTKLTRTCGVCGQEFRLAQEFFSHIETHTGAHICKICGDNSENAESLDKHLITHRKVDDKYKKVVCEQCGKKFLSDALLKSHMVSHSDLKTFKCLECGKSFRHQSGLCIHMNSHNKQVECEICQKRFATKQGLFLHSVSHTGIKSYSCKLCDRKFAGPSQLGYHMKKHNGTLPELPCEICGKVYTSKFFLKSHMLLQHEKSKDFSCDGCGEAFAFLKQLENHMETKCAAN